MCVCVCLQAIIFEDPDEPGTLGDMPFMVSETRNSRLRLLDRATDEDAFEILAGVRGELEVRAQPGRHSVARISHVVLAQGVHA